MQLEFQQSVLFFSEDASDSVHDQSAGHSSCMRKRVRIVQKLCRKWRSSSTMAKANSWLFLLVTHLTLCSFCLLAGP